MSTQYFFFYPNVKTYIRKKNTHKTLLYKGSIIPKQQLQTNRINWSKWVFRHCQPFSQTLHSLWQKTKSSLRTDAKLCSQTKSCLSARYASFFAPTELSLSIWFLASPQSFASINLTCLLFSCLSRWNMAVVFQTFQVLTETPLPLRTCFPLASSEVVRSRIFHNTMNQALLCHLSHKAGAALLHLSLPLL